MVVQVAGLIVPITDKLPDEAAWPALFITVPRDSVINVLQLRLLYFEYDLLSGIQEGRRYRKQLAESVG